MNGWRPALRIARRDAMRHRGRSILVLVMVALPVLAVSAAAVVIKTSQLSGAEGVDRRMGAAAARVWTEGSGPVLQAPDPQQGYTTGGAEAHEEETEPFDPAVLTGVLGPDTRLLPIRHGWGGVRLGERVVDLDVTEVDLGDPLAAGLFELTSGRLPRATGEVVANQALLDKGVALGDALDLGARTATVVGVGRHAQNRTVPSVVGPIGSALGGDQGPRAEWLVGTDAVTWQDVRALNALGAVVASRAVLTDPPDVGEVAEQLGYDTGRDEMYAVAALIVVMALLEVVLLAGPAFAVGARRHARSLALMAASGGTPAQSRRVILASGVVLGAVASGAGLLLGVATGWALLPLVQRFDGSWFGPFEVPLGWLAAIALFGLASALLASVVPAWLASRQDVVAVLAGRRGDRKPRAATPVLGLVLLGAGIAGSSYGAVTSDSGNGAIWMAASAVVSVLGMILVVPVVVALVGRLAGRLPLPVRYAARDAARHRTRTVPAVAAVAATVAGVVALGIANASDELENERTYTPQLAMGEGRITVGSGTVLFGEETPDPAPLYDRVEQVVRDTAGDVTTRRVLSVEEAYAPGGFTTVNVVADEAAWQDNDLAYSGPQLLVADTAAGAGIAGTEADAVDGALAAGHLVVLTSAADVAATSAEVREERWESGYAEQPDEVSTHRLPATYVTWEQPVAPAVAIAPARIVEELDLPVLPYELRLTGDIDEPTQTRIEEAVAAVAPESSVYVERGYQRPVEATIILLVLGVLGGVLMLSGTLTATFLALSDARPDLATLSAVGAAPRTRRGVAAAYALVVGAVGALLGAAVGFIPGVAISRPLTSANWGMGEHGPFLDIPWLLIAGVVVVLPLFTAAVVGLTARSRLPMVARLD
ncbi:MAG TPA: ABC transporter permease [Nocardioides sp.]|nr:ABC transporter permease [Nocardioides sp.]